MISGAVLQPPRIKKNHDEKRMAKMNRKIRIVFFKLTTSENLAHSF